VFLVAALRRLRDLLPTSWTDTQRHIYLKKRLKAIEIDAFAAEVCRLSLMLADYPNPDGWRIISQDIFGSDALEKELPECKIVLCNPPFEDFTDRERSLYGNRIQSVHKPYEILQRVLNHPPGLLGFVLPKSAIIGGRYSELQSRIARHYTDIETVALPDRVFVFSDQETMLVLASRPDPKGDAEVFTKTLWVGEEEREPFLKTGRLPEAMKRITSRAVIQKAHKDLWNPPLWEIWDYLRENPRLKEIADIHRGIEWNIPLKENQNTLTSNEPEPGFMKGLDKVPGKLEPYWAQHFVYLNMDVRYRRTSAHSLPWEKPKVIVNAHVLRRSPWRIAGFPDKKGLVCYQNFIGLWMKSNVTIETVAALINSPLANFALFVNEGKWHNRIGTIEVIPIPFLSRINQERTAQLIAEYQSIRAQYEVEKSQEFVADECKERLIKIDSLILNAYDFPPRLERKLLDFFRNYPRPVPFAFPDYFPEDFQPCIPLHKY
ncbi:hypothetical protein KA005_31300, partial [bacterium]|nr:hypothetical protein [bacterium]